MSALAHTKRAFNRAVLPNFAAWLDEEAGMQQDASLHPDHREGVRAFLEKRAPVFQGR
jgi:2-(1,2-epoxy-1,2-dihydrophenyl)acetyl-CoA isomerase